jgi:hypothetical protein
MASTLRKTRSSFEETENGVKGEIYRQASKTAGKYKREASPPYESRKFIGCVAGAVVDEAVKRYAHTW